MTPWLLAWAGSAAVREMPTGDSPGLGKEVWAALTAWGNISDRRELNGAGPSRTEASTKAGPVPEAVGAAERLARGSHGECPRQGRDEGSARSPGRRVSLPIWASSTSRRSRPDSSSSCSGWESASGPPPVESGGTGGGGSSPPPLQPSPGLAWLLLTQHASLPSWWPRDSPSLRGRGPKALLGCSGGGGRSWEHGPFWAATSTHSLPPSLPTTSEGPARGPNTGHSWGGCDPEPAMPAWRPPGLGLSWTPHCGGRPSRGGRAGARTAGGFSGWKGRSLFVKWHRVHAWMWTRGGVSWGGVRVQVLGAEARHPIWKACSWLGDGAALAPRLLPTSGQLVPAHPGAARPSLSPAPAHRLPLLPQGSRPHLPERVLEAQVLAGTALCRAPWPAQHSPGSQCLSCSRPHLPNSLLWRLGEEWMPALCCMTSPASPPPPGTRPSAWCPCCSPCPLELTNTPPPSIVPSHRDLKTGSLREVMWETGGIQPWGGHEGPQVSQGRPHP